MNDSERNRRFNELVRAHGPSRAGLAGLLVLAALCLAVSLYAPLALRGVVDGYLSTNGGAARPDLVYSMAAALVASAMLEGLRSYLVSGIEVQASLAIRNRLVEVILNKDIWYFARNESGVLISRIFNDVDVVCRIYGALLGIISAGGLVVISLLILGLLDLALSGVICLTLAISIALILPVAKLSGRLKEQTLKLMAFAGSTIYRVFTNIHLTKANVMEGHEAGRIAGQLADLRDQNLRLTRVSSVTAPVVSLAFTGGILALALYGSHRVAAGTLAGGTLAAFFAYLLGLIPALVQISSAASALSMSHAAAQSLFEIEDDRKPDVPDVDAAQLCVLPDRLATLAVRNLEVRYPDTDELALQIPELIIPPAAFVAIVGQNGSGKSTLLGTILRFVAPTQGNLEFAGLPLHSFALDAWRRSIAYASPSTTLLPGTIRQNLGYGCLEQPDERAIMESLDLVGAREFVMARPMGLETEIDEHGGGLSSGQAQRLALARVLLQRRKLILLDEATSHLDEAGAIKVLSTLRHHLPDATIVMATHRLSETQIADRCIEIEKGIVRPSMTSVDPIFTCQQAAMPASSMSGLGAASRTVGS